MKVVAEIATEPVMLTTTAVAAFYAITRISTDCEFNTAALANSLIVGIVFMITQLKRK
jgi:hypothetical protein